MNFTAFQNTGISNFPSFSNNFANFDHFFFVKTSSMSLVGLSSAFWKLRPMKLYFWATKDMLEAQKTQWFWFQISFSFLAITHAFFDENELPAPVLKSVLQCGSNAMLNLQIGWEITDLYGKMSEVAFYTLRTVYQTNFLQTK